MPRPRCPSIKQLAEALKADADARIAWVREIGDQEREALGTRIEGYRKALDEWITAEQQALDQWVEQVDDMARCLGRDGESRTG